MSAPLHHLALRTRDVGALAAFYRTWLPVSVVRDEPPRAIWLSLAQGMVLMIEQRAPGEPEVPRGSLDLIAFRVSEPERERLRAELLSHGLLESATEHTLYFRDPDGRRVGLSSYPLP